MSLTGCASIKTKDEMSDWEIAALEESQSRVTLYRDRVQALKISRENRSIPSQEYAKAVPLLQKLIRSELDLQGAIIRKETGLSTHAKNLLYDIQGAAQHAPEFLGGIAIGCLVQLAKSGVTISVH